MNTVLEQKVQRTCSLLESKLFIAFQWRNSDYFSLKKRIIKSKCQKSFLTLLKSKFLIIPSNFKTTLKKINGNSCIQPDLTAVRPTVTRSHYLPKTWEYSPKQAKIIVVISHSFFFLLKPLFCVTNAKWRSELGNTFYCSFCLNQVSFPPAQSILCCSFHKFKVRAAERPL